MNTYIRGPSSILTAAITGENDSSHAPARVNKYLRVGAVGGIRSLWTNDGAEWPPTWAGAFALAALFALAVAVGDNDPRRWEQFSLLFFSVLLFALRFYGGALFTMEKDHWWCGRIDGGDSVNIFAMNFLVVQSGRFVYKRGTYIEQMSPFELYMLFEMCL